MFVIFALKNRQKQIIKICTDGFSVKTAHHFSSALQLRVHLSSQDAVQQAHCEFRERQVIKKQQEGCKGRGRDTMAPIRNEDR